MVCGGFLKWWVSPTTIGFPTKNDHFSPNSVVTLGVLTVIVKAGVARSRWRTGVGRISSLFSWFRACMFVSCVNFRSFRVAQTGVNGFCL